MTALAVGSITVPALVEAPVLPARSYHCGLLPAIVALAWSHLVALDARTPVPAQAIALLRRTEVLALLPAPALEGIARHATWLSVASGTTVIAEGDVGDRYYVLSSGAVRVERAGRHLRDMADPGDGFGEIALLRNVPRTATVTASVDSVLLSVDRTSFLLAVTGDRMLAPCRAMRSGRDVTRRHRCERRPVVARDKAGARAYRMQGMV
jgi:hypothetical protein